MTEDEISVAMYIAAQADPDLSVVSWQGTGGKGYFTRSVRFHVDGSVQLPDLILRNAAGHVWVFELKGSHAESLRDDEPKLIKLRIAYPGAALNNVVAVQSGLPVSAVVDVTLVVAYSSGPRSALCVSSIAHAPWETISRDLQNGASLSAALERGLC